MKTTLEKEREKYSAIWALPKYHDFSPGAMYASTFEQYEPLKSVRIIDIGCGAGAGGKALKSAGYDKIEFLDIVDACHQPAFIQKAIWDDWPSTAMFKRDWGYCCDVLEHIPEHYVGLSLYQMSKGCRKAFLSISLTQDVFGRVIRDELHLTVKPFGWWKSLLSEFGTVTEARDQMDTGVYIVNFAA